jgi:SHS2 domain-containing protein
MKNHGYQEVDHTADLAIRVWAVDFYGLLEEAAAGMYDLMGVKPDPEKPLTGRLTILKSQPENELVDFLSELLFLCEEQAQYYQQFSFIEASQHIRVEMKGFEISSIGRYIKAVTFHALEIAEQEMGLETTITFDI